jgi:hypothetical protein
MEQHGATQRHASEGRRAGGGRILERSYLSKRPSGRQRGTNPNDPGRDREIQKIMSTFFLTSERDAEPIEPLPQTTNTAHSGQSQCSVSSTTAPNNW